MEGNISYLISALDYTMNVQQHAFYKEPLYNEPTVLCKLVGTVVKWNNVSVYVEGQKI